MDCVIVQKRQGITENEENIFENLERIFLVLFTYVKRKMKQNKIELIFFPSNQIC